MSLKKFKILILLVITALFGACSKTVTNNVPVPNISSPTSPNSKDPSLPFEGSHPGQNDMGTINGGGGKGVLCQQNGKTTLEVLDLYEARNVYGLKLIDLGNSESAAKDKTAEMLTRHFWNPHSTSFADLKKVIDDLMIKGFEKKVRYLNPGQKLKLVNDSFEATLEKGCEPVQIATYNDESVILVDKALWEKLDWTNKMALAAHESMYFLARQSGSTNSIATRKLIGRLFSKEGVRPLADGAPLDKKQMLTCSLEIDGIKEAGSIFLYASIDDKNTKGLEAIFHGLGKNPPLFRTSAFFENLTFNHLQYPKFREKRRSELKKDTYPNTGTSVEIEFVGTSDEELKGVLKIYQGAQTIVLANYNFNCQAPDPVPSDFKTKPGRYELKQNDGSADVIQIFQDGSMEVEESRQVDGQGGISRKGVVPYPTACRTKTSAYINKDDGHKIDYTVLGIELGDLTGLRDSAHCKEYIEAFNRRLSQRSLSFTMDFSNYKFVK